MGPQPAANPAPLGWVLKARAPISASTTVMPRPSGIVNVITLASVWRPPIVAGVPSATIRPAARMRIRSARASQAG
jgi:hypothetical protein